MANKQTRSLRKHGLSTQVIKGASIPRDGKPGLGVSLTVKPFEIFKGKACNTAFGKNPASKRKSARRGPGK